MAGSSKKLRLCEAEAPVEDPRKHTLKLVLRGHHEPMFFDISAGDVDRIFRAVQGECESPERSSFVVFDSDRLRIALNLAVTVFCHFLWEPGGLDNVIRITEAKVESDDDQFNAVHVYFGANPVPITINAESEDGDDVENDRNYLNTIFYMLDMEPMPHERLHIVDVDGESAFLRIGDIALLTAPLWLLDRKVRDAMFADDEE